MAFCENCGRPLEGGAAFCGVCGAPIPQVRQPMQAQPSVQSAPQPLPQTQSQAVAQQARARVQAQAAKQRAQRTAQAVDLPDEFGVKGQPVPTGIRWTYKEVLRGRNGLVVGIAIILAVLLVLAGAVMQSGDSPISGGLRALFDFLDREDTFVTAYLAGAALALIPFVALFSLPIALVVKWVYNRRESKVRPTAASEAIHDFDTRFKWNVGYTTLLGLVLWLLIYFIVMFAYSLLVVMLKANGLVPAFYDQPSYLTTLIAAISLALSELVTRSLNRWRLGKTPMNRMLVERLKSGSFDAYLPERYRDPFSKVRIAKLLQAGAANTLRGAVFIARGLDARGRVQDISSFVANVLDTFISLVTFGATGIITEAEEAALEEIAENANARVLFGDEGYVEAAPKKRRVWQRVLMGVGVTAVLVALVAGLLVLDSHGAGNPDNYVVFESVTKIDDSVEHRAVVAGYVVNNSSSSSFSVNYEVEFDLYDASGSPTGQTITCRPDDVAGVGMVGSYAAAIQPGERREFTMVFYETVDGCLRNPRIHVLPSTMQTREQSIAAGESVMARSGEFAVRFGSLYFDSGGAPHVTGTITNNSEYAVKNVIMGVSCFSDRGLPIAVLKSSGDEWSVEILDCSVGSLVQGETAAFDAVLNSSLDPKQFAKGSEGWQSVYGFDVYDLVFTAAQ